MSKSFRALIGGTVLALACAVAGLEGCSSGGDGDGAGGSGGGHAGGNRGGSTGAAGFTGNPQQLCERACEKIGTCYADAGVPVDTVVASCKSNCGQGTSPSDGGQPCTNANAIVAASQACLAKSCDELQPCLEAIPECEGGGSGAAGSSGAAGHPGVGGSSGAAGHPGVGGSSGGAGTSGVAGSPGSGGSSASTWSCTEVASGCACVPTAGGASASCAASYDCCYLVPNTLCNCAASIPANQCQTVATVSGGTVVARCP
jgi:pilus assembly protein FimV